MTLPVAFKYEQNENLEEISLSTEEKVDIYSCKICGKNFCGKSNWIAHFNCHNISNNNNSDGNVETDLQNTCNICLKKFTAKKNLLKHLRLVHKNFSEAERMVVKSRICPERNCGFLCRLMKDLREHIEKCHKIKILKDMLQFPNDIVFQKWKKEEERNTASWFVTWRKKTILADSTKKQTFYCHRSGHYSPKGVGKHKMRSPGSCKIGVTCPAAMEVIESPDGGLSVIYYKTHIGHVQDVTYLKLSSEEKADLAEKIKQGFSFDSILDDVKESINQGKKKRIHLLSKKDLYSIARTLQDRTAYCNRKSIRQEHNESIPEGNKTEECKISEDNHLVVQNIEIKKIKGNATKWFDIYGSDIGIATVKEEYILKTNPDFGSSQKHQLDVSAPQTSEEKVASQIVILSPNTPVPEIVFLPASNATPNQSIIPVQAGMANLESGFIYETEPQMEMNSEVIPEENKKINKSILHLQLAEKLQKISELLPCSQYLTPRQFDLINTKLNCVLDTFSVAKRRETIKKLYSRKKQVVKKNILKNSRRTHSETHFDTFQKT